jgi:hypothetical protein
MTSVFVHKEESTKSTESQSSGPTDPILTNAEARNDKGLSRRLPVSFKSEIEDSTGVLFVTSKMVSIGFKLNGPEFSH